MRITNNNVFVVDFKKEEENGLIETLEKCTGSKWDFISCYARKSQSLYIEVYRYFQYFYFPFKLFLKRKKIQNLVSWQQFYGILFAFYCRLFRVKKRTNLVILTFMYSPKKGIIGSIYKWFMHYAVCNDYVNHIVCFSEKEIDWYINEFNFSPDKISFLPVAVRKMPDYDNTISPEKYVFTAGYSGRDLNFVIKSLNNTTYKLIVADSHTNEPPADNVQIEKEATGDKMFQLMANSYVMITPLKDNLKTVGQLMSLQAMQLGKPVICTDSAGMRPYIVDGYNGLFINNTKEDLINALDKLYKDKDFYDLLSKNALATYNEYSYSRFAERLSALLKDKKYL